MTIDEQYAHVKHIEKCQICESCTKPPTTNPKFDWVLSVIVLIAIFAITVLVMFPDIIIGGFR